MDREAKCVYSEKCPDWIHAYCPVQVLWGCGSGVCLDGTANRRDMQRRSFLLVYYDMLDVLRFTEAEGI